MLDPTVTPVSIRMVVAGDTVYEVQAIQARFSSNGVNVCLVNIAVGRREAPTEFGTAQTNLGFGRGDEVRIFVSDATGVQVVGDSPFDDDDNDVALNPVFTRDSFTLFDGVIDDFGPASLRYGQFSVQVRIFGRLSYLASGTLDTNNLIPKSHLDTGVGWAYGQGTSDGPGKLSLAESQVDLWFALQNALIAIATSSGAPTDSTTAFIQQVFGGDININAQTVLSEIGGSLDWRGVLEPIVPGITSKLNMLMMRQWYFEPFLHRIAAFGEMLRFRILENGQGIKVVPYHPFFLRTSAKEITASTYSGLAWDTGSEYRNYSGTVLVEGGGNDLDTNAANPIAGYYRVSGGALGQVHVGTVPSFLASSSNNMFVGGDGARKFSALTGTDVADRLAKIMTWELNYRNRRFQVECPFFRTDIGPLEAVAVSFPDVPEITQSAGELKIYGSVESVDIVLDAQQAVARTSYTIGYARSYLQQSQLIDPDMGEQEHPFFTSNYIGGRLDQITDRES